MAARANGCSTISRPNRSKACAVGRCGALPVSAAACAPISGADGQHAGAFRAQRQRSASRFGDEQAGDGEMARGPAVFGRSAFHLADLEAVAGVGRFPGISSSWTSRARPPIASRGQQHASGSTHYRRVEQRRSLRPLADLCGLTALYGWRDLVSCGLLRSSRDWDLVAAPLDPMPRAAAAAAPAERGSRADRTRFVHPIAQVTGKAALLRSRRALTPPARPSGLGVKDGRNRNFHADATFVAG